jgi:hypothetical protein
MICFYIHGQIKVSENFFLWMYKKNIRSKEEGNYTYSTNNIKMDQDINTRMQIASAPWHGCEKGNYLYDHATMYKRISPIISPSGKEEFAMAEVIVCRECGKIPPFMADKMGDCPEDLKSTCKK